MEKIMRDGRAWSGSEVTAAKINVYKCQNYDSAMNYIIITVIFNLQKQKTISLLTMMMIFFLMGTFCAYKCKLGARERKKASIGLLYILSYANYFKVSEAAIKHVVKCQSLALTVLALTPQCYPC